MVKTGVVSTGSSGRRGLARQHGQLGLGDLLHGADALDRHRLDHEAAALDDEAVARAVLGLERRPQAVGVGQRHLERGVGAGVADMDAGFGADTRARARPGHAARPRLRRAARRDRLGELGRDVAAERPLDRLLAQHAQVGQAHAVGRQHRGDRGG